MIIKLNEFSGKEFLGEFDQYLKDNEIEHVFGNPNVPWHIGAVERSNRTLRELAGTVTETFHYLFDY